LVEDVALVIPKEFSVLRKEFSLNAVLVDVAEISSMYYFMTKRNITLIKGRVDNANMLADSDRISLVLLSLIKFLASQGTT
jgi:hypothetical protein